MGRVYIYCLCEDDGRVRYIGKTINPRARRMTHLTKPHNGYLRHWVKSRRESGRPIEMIVVDSCDESVWEETERRWIARGRKLGWKLVNHSDGGQGMHTRTPPRDRMWYVYAATSRVQSIEAMELRAKRMIAIRDRAASFPYGHPRVRRWRQDRRDRGLCGASQFLFACIGSSPKRFWAAADNARKNRITPFHKGDVA